MNIYIGNLPYSITEDELREAFAQFGQVDRANIIKDKFSGRSKGFGFVEMPNDGEAQSAIDSGQLLISYQAKIHCPAAWHCSGSHFLTSS